MVDPSDFNRYVTTEVGFATTAAVVKGLKHTVTTDMTLESFVGLVTGSDVVKGELSKIKISDLFNQQANPAVDKKSSRSAKGVTRNVILDLLKERPMSEIEVIDTLMGRGIYKNRKSAYASVHDCHFKFLFNKGLIQPADGDDADGKWRVT